MRRPPLVGTPGTRDEAAVDLAVFAWEWTRLLAGTSWVPADRTEVADQLTRLTSRLVTALVAEPFRPEAGIGIGEAIVRIGYVAPDALDRTVTLLEQRLLLDVGLAERPGLDDRLAELVGKVCLGFTRAVRDRTLDQQEAIRSSSLLAWQRAEAELREQALRDPLTGLPNRAGFARALERHTDAVPAGTVTACMFAVTDLPSVDQVAGRETGDDVLRVLGRRLVARFSGDTGVVAHVGRDEFVVATVDRPGAGDAAGPRLASAQELLSAPVSVGGHRYVVSVAAGLVARPVERTDAAELLRDAERAASWARSRGRDALAIFDNDRDAREAGDRELAADLPDAIEHDRLTTHYQPIVAPVSGRVEAVEVLTRWPHPRQGMVPPSRFLGLAQHGGLAERLGASVLRRACQQAGSWSRSFDDPPVVSVNVSGEQLADRHTPGTVAELLEHTGLPPRLLQLEVNEEATLSDPRVLRGTADLAGFGVHVVVDDFGTGQANIAQLAELPGHGVTGLKLPAEFLERVGPEGTGCTTAVAGRAVQVLAATVALAHDLGLRVTVEGVETAAQHQLMRDLGVDLGQGWHYGVPEDAERTARLFH